MSTFARDCLAGKSVLITGALGAIGQAVVSALLSCAADVTANDILPGEEARRLAEKCSWPADHYGYVRADVTQSQEVDLLIRTCLEQVGHLDIALCHAGMVQGCPILRYSEED